MNLIYWLLIILGIIALYIIIAYNSLIVLRTRINNAWAQIDVQLKRRYDLIPNLIKTVQGYVKHEKTVLTELTKARSQLVTGSMDQKAKASNQITEALKSIFAVAENYPNLKANENFKMLQEELSGTESKIAYARQFYNDSVMSFNIKVQRFPTKIIANAFNFTKKEFFKTEGKQRENINVEF
jgi:LemA protein